MVGALDPAAKARSGAAGAVSRVRLRAQSGLTLIEVLMATMVLSIGLAGLLSAFDGGRRATSYSELHSVATGAAERELQRVSSLEWNKLAMKPGAYTASEATPTTYLQNSACDPTNTLPTHGPPCYEYAWGVSSDVEPLVIGSSEAESDSKVADPYTFTTPAPGGTTRLTVTVYRYITWVVDLKCEPVSSCTSESTTKNAKRVTVAVEVAGLRKPVVVGTIVDDSEPIAHPLGEAKCLETKEGKEEKVPCQ